LVLRYITFVPRSTHSALWSFVNISYFCSSGFDNECSAQALVDLLPSIECLMEPLQLPPTVLALCGNGIVEDDEDCDCGPLRYLHEVDNNIYYRLTQVFFSVPSPRMRHTPSVMPFYTRC
uniref:NPC1_N domain-containing protein n=1 Tax=Angiostrongylus cantonensis TaxID=6313 RepID=A0A0K0D8Q8_ANGCA